jgi:hypothetical protein
MMADGRWQFSREQVRTEHSAQFSRDNLFRKEVNLVSDGSQPFQDGWIVFCISDLKSQFSRKQQKDGD